jgi:hypothetical protein
VTVTHRAQTLRVAVLTPNFLFQQGLGGFCPIKYRSLIGVCTRRKNLF